MSAIFKNCQKVQFQLTLADLLPIYITLLPIRTRKKNQPNRYKVYNKNRKGSIKFT